MAAFCTQKDKYYRGEECLVHHEALFTFRGKRITMTASQNTQVYEILADRAASYRLFSRLFLKPLTTEDIDALEDMALETTIAPELEGTMLAEGLNDMGRGLHRRHTGTTRLLSTDYTMCFDGVNAQDGLVAVPYASVFNGSITGEKAILFQEPRAKDLKAYRHEGVKVDESLHLPEDHLSFELSFMADLSDKIREAFDEDDQAEVLRLIDVSQAFLADDILSWYPTFCELALKIVDTRFYRGVLKAAQGYLLLDQESLQDLRHLIS